MKYRIKRDRSGWWVVQSNKGLFMGWEPDYAWTSLKDAVQWVEDRGQKNVKVIF